MKIQTGPTFAYVVGTLPTPPAPQAKASTAIANQVGVGIPSFLRGPKVYAFSPALAPQTPSKEKLLDGLRALSDLITPHCGQKVAIAASGIWLAVDTASTVSTFRDPQSRKVDRLAAAGAVTSDATALLAGILGSPHLDQAARAINFAVVVGNHMHTGQITFSQSELAAFSSDPQSDEVSNLLKVIEVSLPPVAQ